MIKILSRFIVPFLLLLLGCTSQSLETLRYQVKPPGIQGGESEQPSRNAFSPIDSGKNTGCSMESRFRSHLVKLPEELSIGKESAYLHQGSYSRDWYNFSGLLPVITKTNDSGQTVVGWHDQNGGVHISILSKDLSVIERDITFQAKRLRDIHIDDQSIATLALEGSRMVLRKYNLSGLQEWSKVFMVRDYSSTMHNGRIAKRKDGGYAAYFGIHGGGHEADALQQVTADGQIDTSSRLSWTWGCSHSVDQRLVVRGDQLIPVCVGDYYPAGLTLRATGRSQVVSSDIKHRNGLGSPNFGGMVEYKGHFVSILSSAYERQNRDIALVAFDANAPYKSKGRVWLTSTISNEVKPKITTENDSIIVFFHVQGDESQSYESRKLSLEFSGDSFVVRDNAVEKVNLEIGPMEDLVSFQSSKPVIAARSPNDVSSLLIQKVESCQ